jgi:APA family basic amino acid/polyamine antiporter
MCDHNAGVSVERGSVKSLARRLGTFDATMLVMGGIIGSGIFMNPYVVAQQVHTSFLILLAWGIGGLTGLAGSFVYSELAARRPDVGGQYAYLRDALHPIMAFLYGWALLLIIQSGAMAAVALTFSRYFIQLASLPFSDRQVAVAALAGLTIVNCLGVRAGSTVQSALMVLKIAAIAALVLCGIFFTQRVPDSGAGILDRPISIDLLTAFGAAMIPVLFAYGGWQTSGFIAGELRNPKKSLPLGLVIGVSGVIILYLGVNYVCVRTLGPAGLAATVTPAADVMRLALGPKGSFLIAAGISISTLGFLSQGMLTAPRVYYAMAEDRVFFSKVAWIHPRTRVPVFAVGLQGILAVIYTITGKYEQILNYVVSTDFVFFGLTGLSLFVLRKRNNNPEFNPGALTTTPGHPITTLFFIAVCWLVVLSTFYKYTADSLIGLGFILAGIPVYFLWKRYGRSGKI